MKKTKIRTKDQDEFEERFIEQYNDVTDEIGGWMLPKPKPDIRQKGPQRTDVTVHYQTGRKAALGGEAYKRQKIIVKVRAYEQWLFQKRVVDPIFEEFHDRYPY